MFCENCGRPVEGDQRLCSSCAAAQNPQTAEVVDQPPVGWNPYAQDASQAPAGWNAYDPNAAQARADWNTYDPNAAQAPADWNAIDPNATQAPADWNAIDPNATQVLPNWNPYPQNPVNTMPVQQPPKKKGGLVAGIVALAVVAAAAVGVFLNLDGISGFIGRTFQSPEKYLANVESAAIQEYSEELTTSYGTWLDKYDENKTAGEAEIRLTLGDEILSLAETVLQQQGMTMETDWLKDIRLSVNSNVQDAAMQLALGVGLGETDLLSADVILDADAGKGYLGVPSLNSAYLFADVSNGILPENFQNIFSQSQKLSKDFIKALPSEKELNNLIETYSDIVLSGIHTVEKENGSITVNGITQKVIVLNSKISQEDLLNILENVLKKAQKDKTIEKTLKALGDYVNELNNLTGEDIAPVDLYQSFVDAIPGALESLQNTKANVDNSNYIMLKVYVDMKSNVRGHELAIYSDGELDMGPISWLTVVKGNVTYTEATLAGGKITGEITEKKDASTGFYKLSSNNSALFTLELKDVTDKSGTLRLIPSEEMLNSILSESGIPTAFLGSNLALELVYNTQKDTDSCQLNIVVGGKTFLGLDLSLKSVKGGKISLPGNTVDATNQEALMQWVQGVDVSKVLSAMESANVPSDLVELVRTYAGLLQGSVS